MACGRDSEDRRQARMASSPFVIGAATTAAELASVGELFREYAAAPGVQACVDGIAGEVARLPGEYAAPGGALLLATVQGQPAGCVALKPLGSGMVEMKRLFVRPAFRGRQLGAALAAAAIERARAGGHARLCLSTLDTMSEAQALYSRLGFTDIAPFDVPPVRGASYRAIRL